MSRENRLEEAAVYVLNWSPVDITILQDKGERGVDIKNADVVGHISCVGISYKLDYSAGWEACFHGSRQGKWDTNHIAERRTCVALIAQQVV